eukprot:m.251691 g.251691  ORF g.251691 m.251691 type:complete len:147 (+) comp26697_c0_seq5:1095-1535(+)
MTTPLDHLWCAPPWGGSHKKKDQQKETHRNPQQCRNLNLFNTFLLKTLSFLVKAEEPTTEVTTARALETLGGQKVKDRNLVWLQPYTHGARLGSKIATTPKSGMKKPQKKGQKEKKKSHKETLNKNRNITTKNGGGTAADDEDGEL